MSYGKIHFKRKGVYYDYSPLNLNKILGMIRLDDNTAIFIYEKEIPLGDNVEVLTFEQYSEIQTEFLSKEMDKQKTIDELSKEYEQLKKSQIEQDELIMKMLLGGM